MRDLSLPVARAKGGLGSAAFETRCSRTATSGNSKAVCERPQVRPGRTLLASVMAVSALLLTPRIAGADADAAPIDPPHALAHAAPTYPEGESTSAMVIVETVVEVDGSTSAARVVEGSDPFATAALDAVQGYRFDPARKAGKPVRARIRVGISFTAPEVAKPATPDALPQPPATDTPRAAPVDEVQVLGSRSPVSSPTQQRIGRAEIRVLPGAFGDPYRAIDILPGVVPILSGLPYYFIRGAPPSTVGYFVEEVRVPYLFHFGLGPGVIQPALVEDVSLHPAAYPSRYGRYAGGVIAGQLRAPATELRGEAQVRLYDAGAYVESPLANGRAAAGVGGRYSYTAALLSAFAPDIALDYRDYNARASYALSDDVRISTLALGAFDYASNTNNGVERVLFASEFHRLDVRLDRQTSTSASRVALMVGIDRTRLEDARFAQNRLVGFRGRHTVHVRKDFDVEVGLDALAELYGGDLPNPYAVTRKKYEDALNFFSPRTDTSTGGWVAATYFPAKRFELSGTLRGDVFTSAGNVEFGPSPRVSMRVPFSRRLAFVGALGVAPQPPAFAIPVPAVGYRGLPGGLAFAYQKSAGVDVTLPYKFALRAVGFHHTYFNLRDYTRDRSNIDITDISPPRGSPAQGYGLELFVNRKLSDRFGTFLSYTLSRTELGSTAGDAARAAPFDRTHVLQVGSVASFGRGWTASARFLMYTGWPKQTPEGSSSDGSATDSEPSNGRLGAFARLDFRVEKRWALRRAGYVSFVVEGLNVTGTRDVVGQVCSPERGCRDEHFGPVIVPSIGVEAAL